MPSIIQRRLQQAGLSKQTAKGSPQTTATFGYGTDGGSIAKLQLDENEIPLTWSNRDVLAYDRKGIKPGQAIGTLATPSIIGLLLLGILGADAVTAVTVNVSGVTSSGSAPNIIATITTATAHNLAVGQTVTIASVGGATQVNGTFPVASIVDATHFTISMGSTVVSAYTSGGTVTTGYSHVLTPAATLPYLTAFGQFGTADWIQLADSKVSSLELSWENAGRVAVKHEISAITPAMLASAYTVTNLEIPSSSSYLTAGGGTFTVEGNSFLVTSGSIKFDTHIEQPIASATVLPADVVEGKLETTWSLKILPTDTSLWRETIFGSGAAGALSGPVAFPHLGAVSCLFPSQFGSLTVASPKVRFMVDFPEGNPDGGPSELTLAGTSTLPLTGSSVTATLVNQVASY